MISRQQREALRASTRGDRVQYVEWFGVWHRVVPASRQMGTFTIRCSGARAFGRVAIDLPAEDVCTACAQKESENETV